MGKLLVSGICATTGTDSKHMEITTSRMLSLRSPKRASLRSVIMLGENCIGWECNLDFATVTDLTFKMKSL
jgi:hypothetical protein